MTSEELMKRVVKANQVMAQYQSHKTDAIPNRIQSVNYAYSWDSFDFTTFAYRLTNHNSFTGRLIAAPSDPVTGVMASDILRQFSANEYQSLTGPAKNTIMGFDHLTPMSIYVSKDGYPDLCTLALARVAASEYKAAFVFKEGDLSRTHATVYQKQVVYFLPFPDKRSLLIAASLAFAGFDVRVAAPYSLLEACDVCAVVYPDKQQKKWVAYQTIESDELRKDIQSLFDASAGVSQMFSLPALTKALANHSQPSTNATSACIPSEWSPIVDGKDLVALVTSKFAEERTGDEWKDINVSSTHNGVDFALEKGTVIRAPFSGWVTVKSAADGSAYGNRIELRPTRDSSDYVLFAHLSDSLVKDGLFVTGGTAIAKTGNSGTVTGSNGGYHLHLAVFIGGSFVDPLPFVSGVAENTPTNNPGGTSVATVATIALTGLAAVIGIFCLAVGAGLGDYVLGKLGSSAFSGDVSRLAEFLATRGSFKHPAKGAVRLRYVSDGSTQVFNRLQTMAFVQHLVKLPMSYLGLTVSVSDWEFSPLPVLYLQGFQEPFVVQTVEYSRLWNYPFCLTCYHEGSYVRLFAQGASFVQM